MEDLKEEIKKLKEEGLDEYSAVRVLLLTYAVSLSHIVRQNYRNMSYRQEDALWYANSIIELDKISTSLLLKEGR